MNAFTNNQLHMLDKKIKEKERKLLKASKEYYEYMDNNPDVRNGLEIIKRYLIAYNKHKIMYEELASCIDTEKYKLLRLFHHHLPENTSLSFTPQFSKGATDYIEHLKSDEIKRLLRGYYYHYAMAKSYLQAAMNNLDAQQEEEKISKAFKLVNRANDLTLQINKFIDKYNKICPMDFGFEIKGKIKEFSKRGDNEVVFHMLNEMEPYTRLIAKSELSEKQLMISNLALSNEKFKVMKNAALRLMPN